jgi:PAS domain S-box-containing protein
MDGGFGRSLGAMVRRLETFGGGAARKAIWGATTLRDQGAGWLQPLLPPPLLRTALVIAAVFVLDWLAPLGVAIGVAYSAAVISAVPLRRPGAIFCTAAVCTLLLMIGWLISPARGNTELWKVVLNEFLGLAAVWAGAAGANSWKRLEMRRQKDLRDNRLVQQAAALSMSSHSLEESLQSCVNILCDITGWPVGHVYVPDSRRNRLVPTKIWRIANSEEYGEFRRLTEQRSLAPGEDLPGRAWTENRTIWVTDVRRNADYSRQPLPNEDAVVGAFCFPVSAGGEVAAVLEFLSPRAVAPDSDTILLISRVGEELGRNIERRRFQEERSRLAAVVDSSYDAIIAKDLSGVITSWNKGAEGVYGYVAEEAIGQRGSLLSPQDRQVEEPEIIEVLQHGHSLRHFETVRRRKDGELIDVSITVSPLRDAEGHIVGTSTIERDVTLRKRREQELERAKEAAETASRAKSEFVANISHELRTPMNAILGMLDLTRRSAELSDHLRDYLDTARESADLLLSLLNDLLDFSRMESGRFELDLAPFSLRAAIDEAMRILALRAHEQGLELTCQVAAAVPNRLEGDSLRLRQILMNLVGNAIKFTPHGEITVRIDLASRDKDEACLLLAVRDTGIGIDPQHQAAIFEPFTQADASSTRRFSGSGLGLTITRELVEKMGGRISLQSEVGNGTEFVCTLRLKILEDRDSLPHRLTREALAGVEVIVADDNASNRQLLSDTLGEWNLDVTSVSDGAAALRALEDGHGRRDRAILMIDSQMPDMSGMEVIARLPDCGSRPVATILMRTTAESELKEGDGRRPDIIVDKPLSQSTILDSLLTVLDGSPIEGGSLSRSPGPAAHSLDVLIVEDTPANQKVLSAILSNRGHHVTLSQNGREAVEAATAHRYDVILMDVQMPVMNGIEATREIRQLPDERAKVPIIALTAHAMPADRVQCRQAGMSGYLAKPIDVDRMIRLVERLAHVQTARPKTSPHYPQTTTAMSNSGISPSVPGGDSVIRIEPALERLGGDRTLLVEIARFFLEDSPGLLEELRSALAQGDAETAARSAHSLKGLASNFDASQAIESARAVEQSALRGDVASAKSGVPVLEAAVAEVSAALRREILPQQG